MAPPNRPAAAVTEGTVVYVQWAPIFAGAVVAAALSFVLHAFAAGIGLSISSTAPTWRDASIALVILSGLYLILVALAAPGYKTSISICRKFLNDHAPKKVRPNGSRQTGR